MTPQGGAGADTGARAGRGPTACLVVAAGAGTRLAAGSPKALVTVAGATLLEHAVARVLSAGCVDLVVVVAPSAALASTRAVVPSGVVVTAGGPTRRDSVAAGLAALAAASEPGGPLGRSADVVLVHDAARCLAPPSLVARVEQAVRAGHAVVVPAVPVHDTVRSLDRDGAGSAVVDRARLLAVQTPQGFALGVLQQAHAGAGPAEAATDDASMAERLGHPVHLVAGAEEAFKVTRPVDLALAGALLAAGATPELTAPDGAAPDLTASDPAAPAGPPR